MRTISWRLGSKTNSPARRAAAERVLPAPKTPLIAHPVRPSHKDSTIALKVASTCPSSRRRKWQEGCMQCPLLLHFHTEQFQFPIANHSSLRVVGEELLALAHWDASLSVHWIPQHNLKPFTGHPKEDLQFLGTFKCLQFDECFGTHWNA